MERFCRFILCLSIAAFHLSAQAQEEITGDFLARMDNILASIPPSSGNVYQHPTAMESTSWEELVGKIVDTDYAGAATLATQLDYALIKFTDNTTSDGSIYYILERTSGSPNYWGTYVFNDEPNRSKLIIESPHPVFDTNTGKQGAHVFKETGARAFFVSGTHRCNASTFTSCSGTTSVCGSSQAYRISDVAHNIEGPFHLATEVLNNKISQAVFIQLHGFGKQTGDPSAILSNGTRNTPSPDYIGRLQNELVKVDATLTFKAAHLNFDWDKLLAFTNTQGRLINLSVEPCSTSATSTQGRFIHIEQEFDKLRANKQKWQVMATGLAMVFPDEKDPDNEVVTAIRKDTTEVITIFPNPFFDQLNYKFGSASVGLKLYLFGEEGKVSATFDMADQGSISLSALKDGIYIYLVKQGNEILDRGKLMKTSKN